MKAVEKTASDAPAWYSAEAADAWASGYNAADTDCNWQSIETAPLDGTLVDLWIEAEGARFRATDYRWTGTAWEHKSGGTIDHNFGNVAMRATHWCGILAAPSRP